MVAALLLLALTRAEIVERFKAPAVNQADGLVRVYAGCPADMRREYQTRIAGFAADAVQTLYRGIGRKPTRFLRPGIVIHIGDVRTNVAEVVTRVSTNGNDIVTQIFVKSPGYVNLDLLKLAVVQGFYRSVEGREISVEEAVSCYRKASPALRIADDRWRLEEWLVGRGDIKDDEEGLRLMRRIIEPGKASRRDVLTFASRLFLYPPTYDLRFAGKYDNLSLREALRFAKIDPLIGLMALMKAGDITVFGGGRGDELTAAAEAYRLFLLELAKQEKDDKELRNMLDDAEEKLSVAFEKAR